MGNGTVVAREIQPRLPLSPWLVETLCVLLSCVSVPVRVAAEWRFGITNQLGDVRVDLRSVDWIVGEIPMVGKRLTVMRVERVVR
jgi:hypothetical protein